jgi:hypothetical protein
MNFCILHQHLYQADGFQIPPQTQMLQRWPLASRWRKAKRLFQIYCAVFFLLGFISSTFVHCPAFGILIPKALLVLWPAANMNCVKNQAKANFFMV